MGVFISDIYVRSQCRHLGLWLSQSQMLQVHAALVVCQRSSFDSYLFKFILCGSCYLIIKDTPTDCPQGCVSVLCTVSIYGSVFIVLILMLKLSGVLELKGSSPSTEAFTENKPWQTEGKREELTMCGTGEGSTNREARSRLSNGSENKDSDSNNHRYCLFLV